MKIHILNAWIRWTVSVIIGTFGAFFYIGAVRSMVEFSLVPLHVFFYPLTWIVIIGASMFASTFALAVTGWQDGFDTLPIISPAYIAKQVVMFPIWLPKHIFQIIRS